MPNFTLTQIAAEIGATIKGEQSCLVKNIAPIQSAQLGDLTFITSNQYCKYLSTTMASAVVLSPNNAAACQLPALIVNNPKLSLSQLIPLFYPQTESVTGIHSTAIIAPNCQIASTVYIGPHCVIAEGVSIGEHTHIAAGTVIGAQASIGANCKLAANITIYQKVILGDRVIIHSGSVIGADGFGYANNKGQWIKIPQIGSVVIGDDVEIGANTTIDRGMLTDTLIANGVKIDNQVQIGHNVTIGEHTIIAGCVGIAGSTEIGAYCAIGGGVCISDHLVITDRVFISGMSGVGRSIAEPGTYSSAMWSAKSKEFQRNMLRFQQLDQLAKRIRKLEIKCDDTDGC